MLEPVPDATGDRAFGDQRLDVEELFLAHDVGSAALKIGKFNPAFGLAAGKAFGISGADLAEDHELTERPGAGIDIPFEAPGGALALAVALT